MVEAKDVRGDLLARIAAKRAAVHAHLRRHRPRSRRLTTATVVLTSLAAVFTAGPGVGGNDYAVDVGDAFNVPGGAPAVWQGLCLGAALLSAAAAIVSGLSKSQESTAKLNAAAAVDCELEGLAFLLEFGQLPVDDAVKLYRQYITKIDFIEDDVTPAGTSPAPGAGTPEPAPVVAGPASGAGEPEPTPRRERARQPVPADRRPPSAELPPVPPPRRRASLRQTVLRQTPTKDATRRRTPPPSR
jgi:hypothetical protein